MATFLYFAYGSNLMARRLRKSCPSAKLFGCARLDNHSLCFWDLQTGPSGRWQGAVATITPKEGDHVWGAVWEIEQTEMANLDKQESLHTGIYRRYPVQAEMSGSDGGGDGGGCRDCVSYAMVEYTAEQRKGVPSPHYLRVIRDGSADCGLPDEYQKRLNSIQDNGFTGDVSGMIGLY
ncbi:gamma-glutamylcyclotransferase-like [Sycon ciliatum]|uniref:gamma-glutamylcyclotransferase-like n=1 Tax=Sycon ciliatum TaxID=27933 RepID=UPI0031F66788